MQARAASRATPTQAGRDWLPTLEGEVDTPCGRAPVEFVDPSQPVVCVPILRAGLVLLEQAATVLPSQITFHFGACDSVPAAAALPTAQLTCSTPQAWRATR